MRASRVARVSRAGAADFWAVRVEAEPARSKPSPAAANFTRRENTEAGGMGGKVRPREGERLAAIPLRVAASWQRVRLPLKLPSTAV